MKNKAENVVSRRVDAGLRGHSLLPSKFYIPAAHFTYLFIVSGYQPSANVSISLTYSRFLKRPIFAPYERIPENLSGGKCLIILRYLNTISPIHQFYEIK